MQVAELWLGHDFLSGVFKTEKSKTSSKGKRRDGIRD